MLDKQTEERIKMMAQDYEYQTRGVPQRLDHWVNEVVVNVENAKRQQQYVTEKRIAYIQAEAEQVAKDIRNYSLKELKGEHLGYSTIYNAKIEEREKEMNKFSKRKKTSAILTLVGFVICLISISANSSIIMSLSLLVCYIAGIVVLTSSLAYRKAKDKDITQEDNLDGYRLRLLMGVIENKVYRDKKFANEIKYDEYWKSRCPENLKRQLEEEKLQLDESGTYYLSDDELNESED